MGTCRTAASGAERRRQCGLQLKEERIKERYEKGAARSQLKVANTHSTLLSRTNTHTHVRQQRQLNACVCVCVRIVGTRKNQRKWCLRIAPLV